jgi:hypothetical protein
MIGRMDGVNAIQNGKETSIIHKFDEWDKNETL